MLGTNCQKTSERYTDQNFKQLTNINYVAIGAPVLNLWNTWKEAGLLNGAQGVVMDIIFPTIRDKNSQPETIIVKFENWIGPQFFNDPEK